MNNTFQVLTYNIFKFNSQASRDKVVSEVLAQGADLMCFQEVFNSTIPRIGRNARKILEEKLPPEGFTTKWYRTSGLGARDGLLVAVKDARFEFRGVSDQDYFTGYLSRGLKRRGLQCALVREREGGRVIAICNTHLTLGTKPKQRQRRHRELTEAVNLIRSIEERHAPAATILVGDFNALDKFEEIRMLTLPTGGEPPLFQDTFTHRNPGSDGFTIDLENNTIIRRRGGGRFEGSARIDYVLLRPPHGIGGPDLVDPQSSRVVLDQPDPESGESLSDHFGVSTTFELA